MQVYAKNAQLMGNSQQKTFQTTLHNIHWSIDRFPPAFITPAAEPKFIDGEYYEKRFGFNEGTFQTYFGVVTT